jgi:hypothetical protein
VKAITDYILALVDLVEAEARSLRRAMLRAVSGAVLLMLAGLIALGAVGLLAASLYMKLAEIMTPAHATLLCGAAGALAAIVLAKVGLWLGK